MGRDNGLQLALSPQWEIGCWCVVTAELGLRHGVVAPIADKGVTRITSDSSYYYSQVTGVNRGEIRIRKEDTEEEPGQDKDENVITADKGAIGEDTKVAGAFEDCLCYFLVSLSITAAGSYLQRMLPSIFFAM